MHRKRKEELIKKGKQRQKMIILGNLLDMGFSLEKSRILVGLSIDEIYALMLLNILEIEEWKIKEEAMEKEKILIVKKLLKQNFRIEDISKITELSQEKIKKIIRK